MTIENHTTQSQVYEHGYKLYTDDYKEISKTYHVRIDPKGYARDSGDTYLTVQYGTPGSHRVTAETFVSGESTASDSNSASIDIRK